MWVNNILSVLLFVLHLGVSSGTTRLGYCSDGSTDCDWKDYLRDVLLQGLFGWVIAGVVLATLVAYVCSVLVCCCVRCCCRHRPQKSGQKLYVYYSIRFLAWVALLAAGVGLAISLIGWFEISNGWSSAWAAVKYFTTTLINLMLGLQSQLQALQTKLLSSAIFVNLPELRDIISTTAISSTLSFAQEVNNIIQDVQDIANLAFLIYRWTIIGFFCMVVAVTAIFALLTLCYKALRCSSCCLILLGLLSTFLMWLSVGVVVVGHRLLSDTCYDLTDALGNSSHVTGLLNELKCGQNNNSLRVVYNVYTKGVVLLNQSFCLAVVKTCKVGSLNSCACRSDGDTERFLNDTFVSGDPTCTSNCTVASCASRCSQAQLVTTSSALADISFVRATLISSRPLLDILQDCQFFVDSLFRPVQALCGTFQHGLWLLIVGQIILGSAGLLCIVCLIIVECWLRSYSPVVVPHEERGIVIKVRSEKDSKGGDLLETSLVADYPP